MVGHGDESKYFYISFFDPRPLTPNELKMRDILMGPVVSFAKNEYQNFGFFEEKLIFEILGNLLLMK